MDVLQLISLGVIFIFIGFALLFIGSILMLKSKVEYGGVVLIGPIPIVSFGSSREMVKFVLVISLVLVIIFLIFSKI